MPKKYIASIIGYDSKGDQVEDYEHKVNSEQEAILHCYIQTNLTRGDVQYHHYDLRLNREDG